MPNIERRVFELEKMASLTVSKPQIQINPEARYAEVLSKLKAISAQPPSSGDEVQQALRAIERLKNSRLGMVLEYPTGGATQRVNCPFDSYND